MRFAPLILVGLSFIGCTRPLQDLTPPPVDKPRVPTFGETNPIGRIAGRVIWNGGTPVAPQVKGLIDTGSGVAWGEMPNHLAPRIDPEAQGLEDVVVYLKRCDPTLAKPWPFAPLRVEVRNRMISAAQGGRNGRVGFARVGESFEMVSFDGVPHMLRARGAGFFTVPLPEKNKPQTRSIDALGPTVFTSAAGYFWTSAEVFTCEHPYYTATDKTGRFALEGIPPGEYTIVAWHRNWKLLGSERDPETGKIMRLIFDAPFQIERPITVAADTPDIVLTLPK